ncbi:MAG: hypothetical protein WCG66_10590 [bacterium]
MKAPLLLSATVLLGLVPHCLARNLVANPGFEQMKVSWKTFEPEGVMMDWGIDDSDPHSGGAAAIIKSTSPARWALSSELIGVYPGKRYRIESWVRVSPNSTVASGLPGFYMGAGFMDAYFESLSKQPPHNRIFFGLPNGVVDWENRKLLQPEKMPEQWTKVSAVFEAPPDAKFMKTGITLHGFEGDLFWDDVSVEEVDASTPLTESLR